MATDEAIKAKLMEDGYQETKVDSVAERLQNIDQSLSEAVNMWVNSDQLSDVNVEGYSLTKLTSEFGMKVPAAILTLDWLIREPELAKESINKPHDKVVRNQDDQTA